MIFVSTLSVRNHWDAIKTIKRFVDNGLTKIELGADHGFMKDPGKVIKLKKEYGLDYTLHAFFPPARKNFMLNIGSVHKKILEDSIKVAKRCIEFCNKSGARLYSMHTPYLAEIDKKGNPLSKMIKVERCVEIMKDSLVEISDYAKRYGVKVALENHSGSNEALRFTRLSMIKEIIKSTGVRNVGLLVDIGHLNVAATKYEFDKKKEVEEVKDMIMELHVHENNGRKDMHKPLSNGSMLECFPKEILKRKILTLEGKNWSFNDIEKSKEIVKSLV